jgi:hypothetical protein
LLAAATRLHDERHGQKLDTVFFLTRSLQKIGEACPVALLFLHDLTDTAGSC